MPTADKHRKNKPAHKSELISNGRLAIRDKDLACTNAPQPGRWGPIAERGERKGGETQGQKKREAPVEAKMDVFKYHLRVIFNPSPGSDRHL